MSVHGSMGFALHGDDMEQIIVRKVKATAKWIMKESHYYATA